MTSIGVVLASLSGALLGVVLAWAAGSSFSHFVFKSWRRATTLEHVAASSKLPASGENSEKTHELTHA
jgi:hypothetical protein